MTDFKFEFGRWRINKISREKIIMELERVANIFNYTDFRIKDFEEIANMSADTVVREFGNWEKALSFLATLLKEKGIELQVRKRGRFTTQELFNEMERIWVKVGHRPSRDEWEAASAKISHDTYDRYFKSWQNACLQFIEYKSGGAITADTDFQKEEGANNEKVGKETAEREKRGKIKIGNARAIPLSLRLKILNRDNFRCVFCGKSPATDIGTKLHIDHIVPFSKGGKSTLENLQTLCEECNLGKSNRAVINRLK